MKCYVLQFEWGEYSDKGWRIAAVVDSEEKAKQFCNTYNRLQEWAAKTYSNIKSTIEVYEKTKRYEICGMTTRPDRPHKSTIDPSQKISQKDWETKYLAPWRELEQKYSDLNRQVWDMTKSYEKELQQQALNSLELSDRTFFEKHLEFYTYCDIDISYEAFELG